MGADSSPPLCRYPGTLTAAVRRVSGPGAVLLTLPYRLSLQQVPGGTVVLHTAVHVEVVPGDVAVRGHLRLAAVDHWRVTEGRWEVRADVRAKFKGEAQQMRRRQGTGIAKYFIRACSTELITSVSGRLSRMSHL